jgi:hypothetical protein
LQEEEQFFPQFDEPKLSRFNPLFQKLQTDQSIIVFPTKLFTDVIKLPAYKEGEKFGRVRYRGVLRL